MRFVIRAEEAEALLANAEYVAQGDDEHPETLAKQLAQQVIELFAEAEVEVG